MMKETFLAIITLFIAVDAIGTLPIFISFTDKMKENERKKIIYQSVITALLIALIFIFVGKSFFKFIGITIHDFMIAGGLMLFCFAIIEILSKDKYEKKYYENIGVVPLGTPLITGPAVLTTSLIILDQYGIISTLISIIFNILLAGFIFYFSHYFIKIFGKTGTNAVSKIMALLLASIAVMLVRKGINGLF